MPIRNRLPWLLLMLAAAPLGLGIDWGLPRRDADRFLFGDRAPWTGEHLLRLTGGWSADQARGADVDRDPLASNGPAVANADDAARAAIVLRYRLYSAQPDEMITFRALSGMAPGAGRLDPRLYQYGGLWIYPVGALLQVADALGLVELRGDLAFYLDRPEQFARFYVVARVYAAGWGLLLVWVAGRIVFDATGSPGWRAVAMAGAALLPVVIAMSHEAKPHLPGAALALLSAWLAARIARGEAETAPTRWRRLLTCGAAAGAACAMVASMAPTAAMALLAGWASGRGLRGRALGAGVAAGAALLVYALTNPYVVLHLAGDRGLLASNVGNTAAMYGPRGILDGMLNAARLLGDAASPLVAIAGAVGVALLVARGRARLPRAIAWPLLLGAMVWAPGALLADGKPGEFARFFIVPAAALWMGLCVALHRARTPARGGVAALLLMLPWSVSYAWHFLRDAQARPTRAIVAERLDALRAGGARRLSIPADPAPYVLPPVDLFEWTLIVDRAGDADADLRLRPIDRAAERARHPSASLWIRPRLLHTPITWAGKSWLLERRDDRPDR